MTVREIPAEATRQLRHSVLWPHLNSTKECFLDVDHQEGGFHLGTYLDNSLVSIGSFFPEHHPELPGKKHYRLRAMATDPQKRGAGAGRALMLTAEAKLSQLGVDLLWCDARKVAIDFYLTLGFEITGDWYDKPSIGLHKLMYKKIGQQSKAQL